MNTNIGKDLNVSDARKYHNKLFQELKGCIYTVQTKEEMEDLIRINPSVQLVDHFCEKIEKLQDEIREKEA